jgi:hypothetical protein
MLPVTFTEKTVSPAGSWIFEDGLLGKNPGKTNYSAKLTSLRPSAGSATVQVEMKATSKVEEARDKEGKLTKEPKDFIELTTGDASLSGKIAFGGATAGGAISGRVQSAHLKLQIDVTRKRSVPNPDKPEEPLESRIDVQANLKVQALSSKAAPPPEKKESKPDKKP